MTNKQLNKMLRNEGLLFTLGSVVISLVVGIRGYGLFLYGKESRTQILMFITSAQKF